MIKNNQEIQKHIAKQFQQRLGYALNLNNPRTFNEKIQWLKIYYRNSLLTQCADKYLVRDYVQEKIGSNYLIPLLGVYNDEKQINFKQLPNQFVLKLNNGSGKNIICKDKRNLNIKETREQLKTWLKPENTHYLYSYEWAYKNIEPKIICEKFIEEKNHDLCDYKFYCFHGEPKFIRTFRNRGDHTQKNSYTLDWKPLNLSIEKPNSNTSTPKPKKLEAMILIAKILSKDFPFVRVDLYEVENQIFFGELTFYPGAGLNPIIPNRMDFETGDLLNLKRINQQKIKNYLKYKRTRKAKTVIYTAISDNYENLKHHQYLSKDYDYICFTNQKIDHPGAWEIKPLIDIKKDPIRTARYHKIFPHLLLKKYKNSIWIDSNINVLTDSLEKRIEDLTQNNQKIYSGIHPERNCLYQEAKVCVELKKDDPFTILKQIEFIKSEKYPKNNGLFETNFIFRNHHDAKIIKAMEDWWYMVSNFSRRDQLSFNYVLWKNKIKCGQLFDKNVRFMNDDFMFSDHGNKIVSTITVGKNRDFTEDNFIQKVVNLNSNNYQIEINLNSFEDFNQIKLEPIKNQPCQFRLTEIKIDSVMVPLKDIKYTTNGKIIDKNFFNFTESPEIIFNINQKNKITISGEIFLDNDVSGTDGKSANSSETIKKLQNDLDKIQSSKVYKLWQKYNQIKRKLIRYIQ